MNHMYDSVGEALTMLEYGNTTERDKALTTLALSDYEKSTTKYYDEIWRVFLSDENHSIRNHALHICIQLKPWKVFEIKEFCASHLGEGKDKVYQYNHYNKATYWMLCINEIEHDLFKILEDCHKDKVLRILKSK